jgi:hypothetical protein
MSRSPHLTASGNDPPSASGNLRIVSGARHLPTTAQTPVPGDSRCLCHGRGDSEAFLILKRRHVNGCANFATEAVAAGLAERTVRVAERQGQLMVEMVQVALREVDLLLEQALAFKAALARQGRLLGES